MHSLAVITIYRVFYKFLGLNQNFLKDESLSVTQNKTKARIRISIEEEGELDTLLKRISSRKSAHKIRSFFLIVDDAGQRLTQCALRGHFDRTREAAGISKILFQFRDLRGNPVLTKQNLVEI